MNASAPINSATAAALSADLSRGAILVPAVGPVPRFWTAREAKILRQAYPVGGVMGAAALLPGRTVGSIYQQAARWKLRSPREAATPRQRWTTTPHIDDAIRRAYQAPPHRGMLRELAARVMRPEAWVRGRAVRLGVVMPRFQEPAWTPREIEIAREMATRDPANIRLALKRAGFKRTATAIVVKLKRLGASTVDEDDDRMSARGLGELMGVESKTVTSWIEKGWLRATRKNAKARDDGRAVEWRIRPSDVRRFVVENVAAVDLRKVDKFWFVDLIAAPVSKRGELE